MLRMQSAVDVHMRKAKNDDNLKKQKSNINPILYMFILYNNK